MQNVELDPHYLHWGYAIPETFLEHTEEEPLK